jgi:hypothetical protein
MFEENRINPLLNQHGISLNTIWEGAADGSKFRGRSVVRYDLNDIEYAWLIKHHD